MIVLRKLTVNNMSIEAYEQYGIHPSPQVLTTCDWARREEAIENHRANMLARQYDPRRN